MGRTRTGTGLAGGRCGSRGLRGTIVGHCRPKERMERGEKSRVGGGDLAEKDRRETAGCHRSGMNQ
jgi:hypothetical protein